MVGITIEAVQLGFALSEIDVDAGLGKSIVARDGAAELLCINSNFAGEFSKIRCADKISVLDELPRDCGGRDR